MLNSFRAAPEYYVSILPDTEVHLEVPQEQITEETLLKLQDKSAIILLMAYAEYKDEDGDVLSNEFCFSFHNEGKIRFCREHNR